MSVVRNDPAQLDRSVRNLDGFRHAPARGLTRPGCFKEWLHFCIQLPEGDLIVNFGVTERRSPKGTIFAEAHVTVLYRDSRWQGAIHSIPAARARMNEGQIDLDFGAGRLRWTNGTFQLDVLRGPVQLNARLLPAMIPTVSLGVERSLHWVIIPRLRATGVVRTAGRERHFENAPAYHDHNWGDFSWGSDLAWEWGFALPEEAACPWAVVFSRILASPGGVARKQGTIVWRGERYVRTFAEQEMVVGLEGSHQGSEPSGPLTLPAACALLVPGRASGVPARFELNAEGRGDRLRLQFTTESHARIAIPDEGNDQRIVLLNEVSGRVEVDGFIQGESFAFSSPAIMEFVRGR